MKRHSDPQIHEGTFRFGGRETWQIGLSAYFGSFRDAFGLHQMQYLLQRPGEAVPVLELAELGGNQVVLNQLCTEDVADSKAIAQCLQRIETLKDDLAIAQTTGNAERTAEIQVEIEAIKSQLGRAHSLGGRRRRLGDLGDRVRSRVCFTLRTSLKKLVLHDPNLGEHLRASIKLGFKCSYHPLKPMHWVFYK
jgi:hypothetical protein